MNRESVYNARMNKHLKSLLIGAGSVLAIYPSTNFASYVPPGSSSERMRGYWEQAGSHLYAALTEYNEQQDGEEKDQESE